MPASPRAFDELRPVSFQLGFVIHPEGSVLISAGNTRVLCNATVQETLPAWLKYSNKRHGWVTAEYAMLPRSTAVRSNRETLTPKGRTQEIQRLIGRSLRSAVNLDRLGERQIIIDCDVLQADGGTRTASVTAACLALKMAEKKWLDRGIITQAVTRDVIGGISVGIYDGVPVLDPDCNEDSSGQADVNFVLTKSGNIIEIQGTAETSPFSYDSFNTMYALACQGVSSILETIEQQRTEVPSKQQKTPYKFGTLGSILTQKAS